MSRKTAARGKRMVMAKGLRFTCRQCGDCCRDFPVSLSEPETQRLDAIDWSGILGDHGLHVWEHATLGGARGTYLKRRRPDGACIFLGQDSLCEIHRHHGEAVKPLACRLFPFTFVAGPEGKPPTATGYFSCSAVAAGDGKPLAQRRRDLEGLLDELVAAGQPPRLRSDPVVWSGHSAWSRSDVDVLLRYMVKEMEEAHCPFPDRLLGVVKFLSLVAGSGFDDLGEPKAAKMVDAFAAGIHDQVTRGLLRPRMGRPPMPERILFRQLLAAAARRDPATLLTAGMFRRVVRRFGNLLAGLAFMAGSGGFVPVGRERRVNLLDVRLHAPPADPTTPIADGALTRYFVAQLSSGLILAPNFEVPALLPALGLLARQYPMILLFARAACLSRGGDELDRSDYVAGIRTADWNFGRVPWTLGVLGRLRGRFFSDVEAVFGHVPWCAEPPKSSTPEAAG